MAKRGYTPEQFFAAFWAKVEPDGDCLIWTGAKTKSRGQWRGRVRVGGKLRYTHQIALEAKLGRKILPGHQSNHTCDRSLCVRGEHLYEGTQPQNVRDMNERGRAVVMRGSRHGRAKLTETTAALALAMVAAGGSHRRVAAMLQVSHQTIQALVAGRVWKHVRPLPIAVA